MKKIYNLISIITLVTAGNGVMAQAPTITSVAVPQIGYTYNMASDTNATDLPTFTVSAGSASAQTWDYSSEFSNVYGETNAFVAPSGGTGASDFPGANMAFQSSQGWIYLVGNTSGLYIDGVNTTIQGNQVSIDFTPNPAQFTVPFTYTSTPVTTDYSATFSVTVSGFPATVNHLAHRVVSADAFGSLTTPAGTYANTLRLKTYEITSDSAFVFGSFAFAQYDTTTNYSWLQNTTSSLLMSIDLTKTLAPKKAQYLQSLSFGVATVSQPSASLNAFPNPASGMTYLTYENKANGPVNLTLSDVTGNQVAVLVNEQQNVGSQKLAINTEALHLPKGLYFLQLNTNNTLRTIKLVVE